MSKGMRGAEFVPQGLPPQEAPTDGPPAAVPPTFHGTARDSKGRYPASLNVGGTHPDKKHPGARHVKD